MRMRLHWFPIGVFLLTVLTWIASYLIAVSLGHVEPDLPYISDTGTYPPESCIFGQALNLSAALAAITIYIRYMQVDQYSRDRPKLKSPNSVCLFFGILSSIGISVVANFQEKNVFTVHIVGAIMAFGSGIVYAWIQTWISYKLHPYETGLCICHMRLVFSFLATASFIVMEVFTVLAHRKFHGDNPSKWNPGDGGWTEHVIASSSEWALGLLILLYLSSFAYEFKSRSITPPQLYRTSGDYPIRHPIADVAHIEHDALRPDDGSDSSGERHALPVNNS